MRQGFAIIGLMALSPSILLAQPQAQQAAPASRTALEAAVNSPTRTAANRARDAARHPAETLAFFGIQPGQTVVELIPGGGWYTEILAPYLGPQGRLLLAQPAGRGAEALQAKIAADPVYARTALTAMPPTAEQVPDGSVDAVITFRNMHNLIMRGDGGERAVLARAFAMLKPGGTLGIVDHRLPEDRPAEQERTSGYLKTSTVRQAAEAAGFEFVAASEVNANSRDTADHPNGVWSLPPTLRGGDTDRARFQAIGESDRMTLKFRKPL
ncbi:putative methyltransferase [Sphingomonas jejuensis]|uniref:Methyltransferase n=1 Tax=Sphingomonas jejuensis TaxID=904715 RepID=A0ABX0XKY9_9SPHN|nr:class I SAM-dependent methyltransferase [Sphingomonas jejuensis]NJC34031.1 putative methyltransferase [Sphingomonas jejuensis]